MGNLLRKLALGASLLVGAVGCGRNEAPKKSGNLEAKVVATQKAPEVTESNRFLREFPEKIPGARSVKKYEVPGAKDCLVHIGQKHYVSLGGWEVEKDPDVKKVYQEFIAGVNRNQENVAKIIYHLHDRDKDLEILNEGYFKPLSRKKINRDYSLGIVHASRKLDEDKNVVLKKYPYLPGAELFASLAGIAKLSPAEDEVIYERAKKGDKEAMYDGREDYVLKKAWEDRKPYSYVVFGSKHDFKDNIDRWNSKKPDKKMSLIRVDPEEENGR
ncbi:MAG: hypothetical protein KKF56_02760 [Nanoarchaeota archaeon]|nr:hypothetical protein [Nanoarchaeota archaeon]